MRKKSVYVCQECGTAHLRWVGKCEGCGAWNSIVIQEQHLSKKKNALHENVAVASLAGPVQGVGRFDTQIGELNRVLGGGLVRGSAVLIAGEPGIGKSTLLLQLAALASQAASNCLYASGEESVEQIQMRAARLGLRSSDVQLVATNSLEEILAIKKKMTATLGFMIVDSIQTLRSDSIDSSPGTVGQVKGCAMELISDAKSTDVSLVMVGHITKDGQIAGPKVLEHMVDTVIYFEGDGSQQYRIIRAVKNRYGPSNEIGIFEMHNDGLKEVQNPSAILMPSHDIRSSGSCIFVGVEGTRPVVVEIQALVAASFLATPRRSAVGWDNNRLAMMLAILSTRYGLNLSNKEVYLNIVGGLRVTEPAADLAVMAALISAASDFIIPKDTAFFGEVGLSGEVRQVQHYESRVNEVKKLGISRVVMPVEKELFSCDIEKIWVKHVLELSKILTNDRGIKNDKSCKSYNES